jgi:antagonist of KipI
VQVPGDGQPVVLLADRPTTGGYAKIATIISVDVPLIAQALPGARVRFQAISIEEAREISLRREYVLRRFLERRHGGRG